jgi:hypothetical protein
MTNDNFVINPHSMNQFSTWCNPFHPLNSVNKYTLLQEFTLGIRWSQIQIV